LILGILFPETTRHAPEFIAVSAKLSPCVERATKTKPGCAFRESAVNPAIFVFGSMFGEIIPSNKS